MKPRRIDRIRASSRDLGRLDHAFNENGSVRTRTNSDQRLDVGVPRRRFRALRGARCPTEPSPSFKYIAIYRDSMEAVVQQPITRDVPVHLESLGKEYGHFTALKALDLTVAEGTSLGFLGPNGAGKSTTIKIMTNLIRPSRGRASLFGIDVRREPTRALARIGAVIETPEFYGYLSPLETLAYAGRLRGMSSKDLRNRSEAVLKEVKLTEWADHRIQEFSKGMKQRLAIAQSLLHPFRKLLDPMVRPFCQLDLFEDGFAAIAEILRRHPAEPARVGEGLQGRQVAVELRGLDDRTDSSERTRRFPPDIDTEEGGPTAGRPNQVRHDLDGRRLAGSIRAEEAERGAFRDRQVEGLEGGEVTVLFAEAFEVHGSIAGDWVLNDGFHGIAIYRDILKTW